MRKLYLQDRNYRGQQFSMKIEITFSDFFQNQQSSHPLR